MVDAARGKAHIVDGHELSYGYKDTSRFATAYDTMKTKLLPIVRDPEKYRKVTSFAFGIWLDYDWRKRGWDTLSPQRMEANCTSRSSRSPPHDDNFQRMPGFP